MKNCAAKEWVVAMKDLGRKGPAVGDVSDGGVCEMIRAAVAARSKEVHQPVANLAPASGVPKPKRRAAPKRVRRGGNRVKERRAFLEAIAAGVRGTTGDAAVEAALGSARGAAAEEAALGSARDAAVEAALGLAGGAAAGEAALNSAGGAPVEGALGSARGAAKPAGATQGAAKPAGATQSAAKPAGAMQSAAKPASATQSAAKPMMADGDEPRTTSQGQRASRTSSLKDNEPRTTRQSWCLACTCLGVQRMAASWYRSSKWSFGCHGWCITVSSAGAALCAAPASGAALCAAPSPAGNAAPAEATISAAPAATAENAAPAAAATSRHAAPAAAKENATPKNATSAAMNAAPDLRLQATLTEEEMQAVFEAAKRAGSADEG